MGQEGFGCADEVPDALKIKSRDAVETQVNKQVTGEAAQPLRLGLSLTLSHTCPSIKKFNRIRLSP